MKISFDLDNTLFVTCKGCPTEPPLGFPHRLFYRERLREGAVGLYDELTKLGCQVCVYSTTIRPAGYIRALFRLHGIHLSEVINRQRHFRMQRERKEPLPSKAPNLFGIDLHVDNDATLKRIASQYGFNVLILDKYDGGWADKVLAEVRRMQSANPS